MVVKKPYLQLIVIAVFLAVSLPNLGLARLWSELWSAFQDKAQQLFSSFYEEPSPAHRPAFRKQPAWIITQDGRRLSFLAEVAETEEQHNYGLMFRDILPMEEGMLFVFDPPRKVGLWMKNTRMPLDVIFIGEAGRVLSVAPDQKPFSLRRIESPDIVRAVLELNAGTAARQGITQGAVLVHPGMAE
jgi:uncharacterized membrane protein (UPF0127 family)